VSACRVDESVIVEGFDAMAKATIELIAQLAPR
jgi:hypothetical protein